jgi:hypothetical protein
MTEEQTKSTTEHVPDKAAIRAELEQVRVDYHVLLDSLSESDWKAESANPAWKVGTLMWHLGRGMEFFSEAVELCRKGKAPNPPAFLVNFGNMLQTRFGARGATRASASAKYDVAHTALLAALDGVQQDEWQKGVTVYGMDYTIESAFRGAKVHFDEHQADVLKGLGRA